MYKKFENWLGNKKQNLSQRDYFLIKKAGDVILGNVCAGEEFAWHPYRCIKPFKFPDGTEEWSNAIWNWDSAFHALGVMEWDTDLAKEQILGFIRYQLEDGMFVDCVRRNGETVCISSKPPVFSYASEQIYKKDGDLEFVKTVYPKLIENLEFWNNLRCYNGLYHYGANLSYSKYSELTRNINFESGWDNSVRWDNSCSDLWPIDLNCFMVMNYRSLSTLAGELGKTDESRFLSEKADELAKNINEYFWNDSLKAYTDVDRFNFKPTDVLSPASFMPMFIGIAPPERADFMAELAADKTKFFPGMPTVAYDNPNFSTDYWRGNTWFNVAYFAAKGLKNYGFNKTADAVKETLLGWVEKDGDCIHENYNSVTGEGLYCPKFSWSSVFVIEFIINWED